MFIIAAAIQNDGVTFGQLMQNLPHDGPAMVVYALVIAFVGFIWHGSRQSGRPKDGA